MANPDLNQKLVLKGSYGIERASELALDFSDALSKTGDIDIDISQVDEFDIPAIQVLYAAASSAKERKVHLNFTGEVKNNMCLKLISSGLSNPNCSSAKEFISSLPHFPGVAK